MSAKFKFFKWRSVSATVVFAGLMVSTMAISTPVVAQDAPAPVEAPKKAVSDEKDPKEKGEDLDGVDLVLDRAKLLMEKLKERQRKVDPFGMSMDPEEELEIVEEEIEEKPRQVTTLEEAVARFRVSGVVPRRREVIVGARSLGIGDRVLIEHREVRFQLSIVDITPHRISLKDQETGEIASVDLGIVPEGLPTAVAGKGAPAPGAGIMAIDSIFEVE